MVGRLCATGRCLPSTLRGKGAPSGVYVASRLACFWDDPAAALLAPALPIHGKCSTHYRFSALAVGVARCCSPLAGAGDVTSSCQRGALALPPQADAAPHTACVPRHCGRTLGSGVETRLQVCPPVPVLAARDVSPLIPLRVCDAIHAAAATPRLSSRSCSRRRRGHRTACQATRRSCRGARALPCGAGWRTA